MAVNNSVPLEVMAAPSATLYVAPVGTAFPLLNASPGGSWRKVGTSGPLNYGEDGVKVSHSDEKNEFYSLGDTGTRKVFRTREQLKIGLTLFDLTLEQYRLALNDNAVTVDVPGNPNYNKVGLSKGLNVATYAVLLRVPSPYMEDGVAQYEIPRAVQSGNPEPTFVKGEPAGLALEWTALVDPDAATEDERFGRFIAQTDDAS